MTEGTKVQGYDLHPIRLQFVYLKRLDFGASYLPKDMPPGLFQLAASGQWHINVSGNVHDNYATVVASVAASFRRAREVLRAADHEDKKQEERLPPYEDPYKLEIDVVAGFVFDPKEIGQDEVDRWCKLGSFFVLAPYVRHIIAQVTRESGFPEILLPLLEVPTFRAPAKRNPQAPTAPAQPHSCQGNAPMGPK